MDVVIYGFAAVLGFLRPAFFAVAVAVAVACLVDWLVRTRRVNPFSPVARFFRKNVDPLFAPMERRVVRAGGLPATAPWWTLAALVVLGIVVISLLEFVLRQLVMARGAAAVGPMGILRIVVGWTFTILRIALVVRVIASWFRLSAYSPWVRWAYFLTEPIISPLRRVIPPLGMIDITPIVAYFVLLLLEGLILGLLRA